jgi:hypothetical protein
MLIVVAVILLSIGIGLGVLFYRNHRKQQANNHGNAQPAAFKNPMFSGLKRGGAAIPSSAEVALARHAAHRSQLTQQQQQQQLPQVKLTTNVMYAPADGNAVYGAAYGGGGGGAGAGATNGEYGIVDTSTSAGGGGGSAAAPPSVIYSIPMENGTASNVLVQSDSNNFYDNGTTGPAQRVPPVQGQDANNFYDLGSSSAATPEQRAAQVYDSGAGAGGDPRYSGYNAPTLDVTEGSATYAIPMEDGPTAADSSA